MDDPQWNAVDVDGIGDLELANDERDEVRRHQHRVCELHTPAAIVDGGLCDFLAARHGGEIVGDDEGDAEDCLEVWLVETGKSSPGVGRLELSRRDDVLFAVVVGIGAPVKAV